MRPRVRVQQYDLVLIKRVVDALATYDVLYVDSDAAAAFVGGRARQAIANMWYMLKASDNETQMRARAALTELREEFEERIRNDGKEAVRVADCGPAGCLDRVSGGDSRLYGTT